MNKKIYTKISHCIGGKQVDDYAIIDGLYHAVFQYNSSFEEFQMEVKREQRSNNIKEFNSQIIDPYVVIEREILHRKQLTKRNKEFVNSFITNYKAAMLMKPTIHKNTITILLRVSGPMNRVRKFFELIKGSNYREFGYVSKDILLYDCDTELLRKIAFNEINSEVMRFTGDTAIFSITDRSKSFNYSYIAKAFYKQLKYCSKICPDLRFDISTYMYSFYNIYDNVFFNINEPNLVGVMETLKPRKIINIPETACMISEYPMRYNVQFTRFYKGRKTKTFDEIIVV